jgi:hypothetical protein
MRRVFKLDVGARVAVLEAFNRLPLLKSLICKSKTGAILPLRKARDLNAQLPKLAVVNLIGLSPFESQSFIAEPHIGFPNQLRSRPLDVEWAVPAGSSPLAVDRYSDKMVSALLRPGRMKASC